MSRLCLNMIVKNEAAIIARCLLSVAPHIDYYVICDTGSSDDTPKVIKQVMDKQGISGEIHTITFENFSQARNAALQAAKDSPAPFEYILLCDADMQLRVETPGFRDQLTADAYLVRQRNSITYSNVRIVRRDRFSEYVGVTHEYISTATPAVQLDGLIFDDHADGGNRHEKIERDIRLLGGALEQNPDDARSWFYLAQTFKDSGKNQEAIEAYQTRIGIGGWDEEVWYSQYMIATCYQRMGDQEAMISAGLKAFQMRPTRAEPLALLASTVRNSGKYDLTMMFALQGVRIPFPDKDRLFIEHGIYQGQFDQDLSVAGFYAADPLAKSIGREACFRMITNRATSPQWRYRARGNARFYVENAVTTFPSFTAQPLSIPLPAGWAAMNPSVSVARDQRWCLLRTVNYWYDTDGHYHSSDPDGVIRTKNVMMLMDRDWRIADTAEIIDDTIAQTFPSQVQGFEDCRLVDLSGQWMISTTVGDRVQPRQVEIAVCDMNEEFHVTRVDVQREVQAHLAQKNWMPMVDEGKLYFVYSLEPITLVQFDQERRQSEIVLQHFAPISLDGLRGGSQMVRVPEGWLCATHEVFADDAGKRTYLHRLVLLDDMLQLRGLTDPFYFEFKGIEFCAGMAHDEERGQLVLTYGIMDREARIALIDLDDAYHALRTPDGEQLFA